MEKLRKSYTVEQKLDSLKRLDENNGNIRGTAKELGLTRSALQLWQKQRAQLESVKDSRDDLVRKRRKLPPLDPEKRKARTQFPELERMLVDWISYMRETGTTVSSADIKSKALSIHGDLHGVDGQFKASNGWLDRFVHRHEICSRPIKKRKPRSKPDFRTSSAGVTLEAMDGDVESMDAPHSSDGPMPVIVIEVKVEPKDLNVEKSDEEAELRSNSA